MSGVALPLARIAKFAIRPVLFSGNQEGSFGGEDLMIPRMGDRWAVDLGTAQLRQDAEARALIAALVRATTGDAIVPVRQPSLPRRSMSPGALVDGAGQTGTTLTLKGMQPNEAIVTNQFLSILHGGRYYLHMATTQAVAGADGKVAVPIWPMLRFITDGDEAVQLPQPLIEGRLVGFEARGFGFTRNRIEPLEFSIVERA